jgi:hypothetical protein
MDTVYILALFRETQTSENDRFSHQVTKENH